MTKEELFETYKINETHSTWDGMIDNLMSVEIYRVLHNGELPTEGDKSISWVLEFLYKAKNDLSWFAQNVMCRPDWGSLYLTAHRMLYRYADLILKEINEP